jgi:DNA-binding transcriptional ArsR family regulator
MMDEIFDAKALALKPEQLVERVRLAGTGIAATKRERRKREFLQMTRRQVERLAKAKSITTATVFHFLLLISWRNPGYPKLLANDGLEQLGVTRQAKYRALSELRELGLIELRSRGRKSPEVVILQL